MYCVIQPGTFLYFKIVKCWVLYMFKENTRKSGDFVVLIPNLKSVMKERKVQYGVIELGELYSDHTPWSIFKRFLRFHKSFLLV